MPIPAVAFAGGIFVVALYKTTEIIWCKAFDAAWTPVDEALKERFGRWAGTDKESQRRAAFEQAAARAYELTTRQAADPQAAERVLGALNSERDQRGAEALAEESAKLMLFSASPDVPRLTQLCQERLHWEALWVGEAAQAIPETEEVAAVLSDFLTNLREALLDQDPYHDLVQREMLRALRQVVAELRPVAYDDEATYRAQLAAMVRELEFVGIPELKERRPITVEDIFIHLRTEQETKVLDSWDMRPGEMWEEAMEKAIKEASLVPRQTAKGPTSIEEMLQTSKKTVVLGDPGTGKTTLLKYLTAICAEGRAEAELGLKADGGEPLLPVFIPLREFADECGQRDQDYCLLDYFYTHAREHLLLHLPRGFFETALEVGRCLVCLDGLDEVWAVGGRKRVRDAVKALAARFPRGRYLVTSRIVGYEKAPLGGRDFIHHSVLPLTDEDIREFIGKWYAARERDPIQRKGRIKDLIDTIEREPRIQSLARNPLLLTIIALVHRIEAELPHERVKLYDKCITALVDTWEEVKGLSIEEKKRPFYRYRRRLLERLAFELHTRAEQPGQVQTVKEGDLELTLTRFLMENRRMGFADDHDGAREEARAFIRLARGRTGLLVERGEGVFGFPHLTFQEYLAACDIENRCIHRGVDAIWEEIKGHLHESHWREVILLLLGSLNKYDEPPTLLVERVLEAGEADRFEPVLHRHLYLAARVLADHVEVATKLGQQVVDELIGIIRIASWWEREDALSALSWLKGNRYTSDNLLALARDTQVDDEIRGDAARALGELGHADEAANILATIARNPNVAAEVRLEAAEASGRLGKADDAEEMLLALAYDPQVPDYVRREAGPAMGRLGCDSGKLQEILLDLINDPKVSIEGRCGAAEALGQLDHPEEKALSGLLTLARNPQEDAWVRREVAEALGELGYIEEAINLLLSQACDPNMNVWLRCGAARILGRLGNTEEKVRQGLLALASDPQANAEVRYASVEALGEFRYSEDILNALLALTHDLQTDKRVCVAAAKALGQLDRADKAIGVLLSVLRDPDIKSQLRLDAAQALGELGYVTQEAAEFFLSLAQNPHVDELVRRDAATYLGHLPHVEKEVLDCLLALTQDTQLEDTWVSREAYESLKRLVGSVVD